MILRVGLPATCIFFNAMLFVYRCYPGKKVAGVFVLTGGWRRGKADLQEGDRYGGGIRRVCNLATPIFLVTCETTKY